MVMITNINAGAYLRKTRLVEEVPGIEAGEEWFLWHGRKTVWHGSTAQAGRDYAAANGITIDAVEYFEP